MPVYTYRREDGTTFDYKQKFLDEPLQTCPTTGQKVVRVIQSPGIIFKGSGFYVNDSKQAHNSTIGKTEGKSTPEAKSDSSSEPKGETTAEAKAPSKSESAAD